MRRAKMSELTRLRKENRSLKETVEILSDKRLMRTIELSLQQINYGKCIPLSQL
jgi:hypothetical protein